MSFRKPNVGAFKTEPLAVCSEKRAGRHFIAAYSIKFWQNVTDIINEANGLLRSLNPGWDGV